MRLAAHIHTSSSTPLHTPSAPLYAPSCPRPHFLLLNPSTHPPHRCMRLAAHVPGVGVQRPDEVTHVPNQVHILLHQAGLDQEGYLQGGVPRVSETLVWPHKCSYLSPRRQGSEGGGGKDHARERRERCEMREMCGRCEVCERSIQGGEITHKGVPKDPTLSHTYLSPPHTRLFTPAPLLPTALAVSLCPAAAAPPSALTPPPPLHHTYSHLPPCSQQRLQGPCAQQKPHHPQPAREDRGRTQRDGRCRRRRCRDRG